MPKKIIAAVLMSILGLFLAAFLFKTLIAAIVGGIAGGVVGAAVSMVLLKDKVGDKARESVVPTSPSVQFTKPLEDLLQDLVQLNLKLRLGGLALEHVEFVEQIIDKLRKVMPQMIERYATETLTYELGRICSNYLPRAIKEFLDLSAASRQAQDGAFKETLQAILDQVSRANDIIESDETGEFQVIARLMQTKFAQ